MEHEVEALRQNAAQRNKADLGRIETDEREVNLEEKPFPVEMEEQK